jgi:hypothetical protein
MSSSNKPTVTELLRRIHLNTAKVNVENKKNWYKVGKLLLNGQKFRWHNESKTGARRTYRFYSIMKGQWNGPSPRQFSKMKKSKFEELMSERVEEEMAATFLKLENELMAPLLVEENLSVWNPE